MQAIEFLGYTVTNEEVNDAIAFLAAHGHADVIADCQTEATAVTLKRAVAAMILRAKMEADGFAAAHEAYAEVHPYVAAL
jgi:hypothetical protein